MHRFMQDTWPPILGLFVVAAILLFVIVGSEQDIHPNANSEADQYAYLQHGNRCVQLSVASTSAQKRRGLSGRKRLAEGEGMVFTYDKLGEYGFWMKDMNFPIDIIWLDEDNKVVTVKDRISPDSFPKTFRPTKPAKNVIEVASGTVGKLKIKSGDRLNLIESTTTKPVGC